MPQTVSNSGCQIQIYSLWHCRFLDLVSHLVNGASSLGSARHVWDPGFDLWETSRPHPCLVLRGNNNSKGLSPPHIIQRRGG